MQCVIGKKMSASMVGKSVLPSLKNLSPFQRPGSGPDGLAERCNFSEQTINLMLTLPVRLLSPLAPFSSSSLWVNQFNSNTEVVWTAPTSLALARRLCCSRSWTICSKFSAVWMHLGFKLLRTWTKYKCWLLVPVPWLNTLCVHTPVLYIWIWQFC